LSGLDEQSTDIPICPICEARPRYWSLYPNLEGRTGHRWAWFVSEEYQGYTSKEQFIFYGLHNLDDVRSVKCRPANADIVSFSQDRHVFTEDSEVFKTVMRLARRLKQ